MDPDTATVLEVLTWRAQAKAASSTAVRKSNTPIDPKEMRAFTWERDLWRTLTETNDCDFHLEISASGAGPAADRVIVEIPQDSTFTATRMCILKKLTDAGVHSSLLGSYLPAAFFTLNSPHGILDASSMRLRPAEPIGRFFRGGVRRSRRIWPP
jgi:hypothetical protein